MLKQIVCQYRVRDYSEEGGVFVAWGEIAMLDTEEGGGSQEDSLTEVQARIHNTSPGGIIEKSTKR